jgi:alkylhydroperoxidase family enzyme
MEPRIAPLSPPFPAAIQEAFDRIMPKGVPPLALFTTVARDQRLFERLLGGNLLDRGNLSLRQREIVIHRVAALSGSEYEWGVHVKLFGEAAGLTEAQLLSLAHDDTADPVWSEDERALLGACDQLHATCNLDAAVWDALRVHFSEEAVLEVLMLAGFYRMVSYLTNAVRLPLEPYAARFPGTA